MPGERAMKEPWEATASARDGQESSTEADRRHPRSVYGVGEEPDVRFSLANERTALAWVRTGLALIAGGVALTTLATLGTTPMLLDILAVIACASGGVLALVALVSWRRNERALRLRRILPAPVALSWLILGVLIMAAALGGYAVFTGISRL